MNTKLRQAQQIKTDVTYDIAATEKLLEDIKVWRLRHNAKRVDKCHAGIAAAQLIARQLDVYKTELNLANSLIKELSNVKG